MRVQFLTSAPFADSKQVNDVLRLLLTIVEGWHTWDWPDPAEYERFDYFSRVPLHYELAVKSFTSSIAYSRRTSPLKVTVVGDNDRIDHAALRLRLAEASYYLSQPLSILVENIRNDGRFHQTMLAAVDANLANQFTLPHPPIKWEQGGGKEEILNVIGTHSKEANGRGYPAREFILVDSDALFPGHTNSKTHKLCRVCEQYRFPVHVLHKRSLENYVPDSFLLAYADAYPPVRQAAEFILSLTDKQRDHFPMKKGLQLPLSDQENNLYLGIDLAQAQKAGVARLLEYVLSNDLRLDPHSLQDRGALTEVRELATEIWEVL